MFEPPVGQILHKRLKRQRKSIIVDSLIVPEKLRQFGTL